MASKGPILCEYELKPILSDYGIESGKESLINSADEAVILSKEYDGPVALKIQSPDILHKTEAGVLALNLIGEEAVRSGFNHVMAAATEQTHGVLIQAMAPKGHEMIVGIHYDATFGSILMLGFGGINVEINPDTAFSPVPLDKEGATDLLDRLTGRAILNGGREIAPADIDALADLAAKLSQFAFDHGDVIAELDLNPVLVHEKGLSIVDALLIKRT